MNRLHFAYWLNRIRREKQIGSEQDNKTPAISEPLVSCVIHESPPLFGGCDEVNANAYY
ncbi:MAG: hypothetical protein ACPHL6_10120 [Rubripirellula sp.]